VAVDKPVPAGQSKYSKLACLFQLYTLFIICWALPGGKINGPLPLKKSVMEEQPGPPPSHRISGSLSAMF